MTFLTNLGVTEILRSFILLREEKTGKEIPQSSRSEFLVKFFAKDFALSDAEDNTFVPLNKGVIADLFIFVENTISNSPNLPSAKFLGSNKLVCFISICKFGSFKNSFLMITSLSEVYFRFRSFILLVQTKK